MIDRLLKSLFAKTQVTTTLQFIRRLHFAKMNFTPSQKGAELAFHKIFTPRRGGKIKNGVSWRCIEAHCKGRLNILTDEIKA